jgi:methylenetetrahydrofolate dehydrogenase (NADP+)/methenyltetrahydrofolate cyclohydrolase/formyltetrahydrofolate synthetase
MPGPNEWRVRLGLHKDEIIPMGKVCKLDSRKILGRMEDCPDGKFIEIAAITPAPLGEGKSTTATGLMEGLGKRGKNVGGCLCQPSGGPTMNIKGTAAGGGNALLLPMAEFSMGLTGKLMANIAAAEALLGRDEHCVGYLRNYRAGKLEFAAA